MESKGSKGLNIVVLDSSVLIEMAHGTRLGELIKDFIIKEKTLAVTGKVALTELYYILCRKIGHARAEAKIKSLINSKYINIHDSNCIYIAAGSIKCDRKISLADSYIIGIAKEVEGAALFARKESEIVEEMTTRPFDVEVNFLEDMA